ncbi:Zinc knuckle [Popillia japonica]|uniref:Zinc knuckle n=1 Tax=Popillia japonica TaxID=7064 RepID=A0AAW1N0E0_POPJA
MVPTMSDKNEVTPSIAAEEEAVRCGFAMGYLISRLDDEYKMLVCELNEPMQVLEKLDSLRYPKIPSTKFILKRSWLDITYLKGKESALEFIARFEEATRKLVRVTDGELKEDDICEHFLMAIYNSVPEVIRRYDAAGGKIALNEIKSIMLNVEASETEAKARCGEVESTVALNAVTEINKGKEDKTNLENAQKVCYRCGKPNHMSFECKSKAIICYNCKELTTTHTTEACRKKKVSGRNRVGYEYKRSRRGRRLYRNIGTRGIQRGTQIRGNTRESILKKVKLVGRKGEKPKFAYVAMEDSEASYVGNMEIEDDTFGEAHTTEVEGANEHMVNNINYLTEVAKVDREIKIKGANSNKDADLKVMHKSVIEFKVSNGKVKRLKDVLYSN